MNQSDSSSRASTTVTSKSHLSSRVQMGGGAGGGGGRGGSHFLYELFHRRDGETVRVDAEQGVHLGVHHRQCIPCQPLRPGEVEARNGLRPLPLSPPPIAPSPSTSKPAAQPAAEPVYMPSGEAQLLCNDRKPSHEHARSHPLPRVFTNSNSHSDGGRGVEGGVDLSQSARLHAPQRNNRAAQVTPLQW